MATVQTTVTTQTVHTQQHSPGRQYGVRIPLFLRVVGKYRASTLI